MNKFIFEEHKEHYLITYKGLPWHIAKVDMVYFEDVGKFVEGLNRLIEMTDETRRLD